VISGRDKRRRLEKDFYAASVVKATMFYKKARMPKL
jgi:hypothetical protein